MNKRRSPKLFLEDKLNPEERKTLIEACNNTPASMNLQLSRLIVVSNKSLLKELGEVSYGNKQVETCSDLFIFCSIDNFDPDNIRDVNVEETEDSISMVGEIMQANGVNKPEGIKKFLKGSSPEKLRGWIDSQCYLTLGVLIQEVIKLGYDSCPLEGFNVDKYSEILGLKELNLRPVVLCAVGLSDIVLGEKKRIPLEKYCKELI